MSTIGEEVGFLNYSCFQKWTSVGTTWTNRHESDRLSINIEEEPFIYSSLAEQILFSVAFS